MGQIDQAALEPIVTEIAHRSNRLREWLDMAKYLSNLDESLNEFCQKVQDLGGSASKPRLAKVKTAWDKCKNTDIVDLRSFAVSVQSLNTPLPTNNNNPNGPNVQDWLSVLLTHVDQVQADLDAMAIGNLALHSTVFRDSLINYLSNQRIALIREVGELCALTIRLSTKLGE